MSLHQVVCSPHMADSCRTGFCNQDKIRRCSWEEQRSKDSAEVSRFPPCPSPHWVCIRKGSPSGTCSSSPLPCRTAGVSCPGGSRTLAGTCHRTRLIRRGWTKRCTPPDIFRSTLRRSARRLGRRCRWGWMGGGGGGVGGRGKAGAGSGGREERGVGEERKKKWKRGPASCVRRRNDPSDKT